MTLIDLSHVIYDGLTTYPGLPAPSIGEHLSFDDSAGVYAAGTEFAIGKISMVANTGTYLDTPAHRYRSGYDLAGLSLDHCVGLDAVVIPMDDDVFDAALLDGLDLAGRAVLLHSGWDQHWANDGYGNPAHPHVDEAGARALVAAGVTLVGIDSVNIDDTRSGARPAHTVLLGAEVLIVEHLTNLGALPRTGARFTAVPPAIRGLATFPVRAFAVADDL